MNERSVHTAGVRGRLTEREWETASPRDVSGGARTSTTSPSARYRTGIETDGTLWRWVLRMWGLARASERPN